VFSGQHCAALAVKPKTKNQKPKAKSQKPKAKSWKPKDLKDIAMKKIVGVPVKGRGPGVGDL